MEQLGSVVLECGRRQMTRVVCDVGQPHRMETCGVEEPYEGNLHVRFCGGIGRVIADPTRTADCLQPPLRYSFRQQLTPGVDMICIATDCAKRTYKITFRQLLAQS